MNSSIPTTTTKKLLPMLLVSSVLLSGCASQMNIVSAHFTAHQKDPATKIEQWIEQQEYDKALKTIAVLSSDHPQYSTLQARKSEIEALARAYEQRVLKQTRAMREQDQWGRALDTYDQAINRMPESRVIQEGLSQFKHKQEVALNAVEEQYLIARGHWLKEAVPLYQQMATIDPRDPDIARQLSIYQQQAKSTALQLASQGKETFFQGNYPKARKTFKLSQSLEPNDTAQEYLLELDKIQRKQAQFESKRLYQEHQRARKALIEKLSQAQANDDWVQAQRVLNTLKRDYYDAEVAVIAKKVDASIGQQIERYLSQGDRFYSDGRYHEAVETWRNILDLDSAHQGAQKRIARAQQVIDNLERIRQQQNGG